MKLNTLKLLKKSKMLLIMLVVGCANKPAPPEINLYLHDQPRATALCTHMGTACPAVPMEKTDNWFMLRPEDWQKEMDYIDLLICKLNGGCGNSTPTSAPVSGKDLEAFRLRMKSMDKSLHSQTIGP